MAWNFITTVKLVRNNFLIKQGRLVDATSCNSHIAASADYKRPRGGLLRMWRRFTNAVSRPWLETGPHGWCNHETRMKPLSHRNFREHHTTKPDFVISQNISDLLKHILLVSCWPVARRVCSLVKRGDTSACVV